MMSVDDIYSLAKSLPDHERRELAVRLFESLGGPFADAETDAAWAFEIQRRVEDMRTGKVKTYPWGEVLKELEEDARQYDAKKSRKRPP
jgi:putative addiction module component (TIGR02574 family)